MDKEKRAAKAADKPVKQIEIETEEGIAPGVTRWTTLGALMEAGKLPSGTAAKLRPWLSRDDIWIGAQSEIKGVTAWQVIRSILGWLLASVDGVELVREEWEIAKPKRMGPERSKREACVDRLHFGDIMAAFVMLTADEDPIYKLTGCRCAECGDAFDVDFDLRELPVRELVVSRNSPELQFDAAGRSWSGWVAPTVFRQWELGSGALLHAILERAFVGGPPVDELRRREGARVMEEITIRMPGPKWGVSQPCQHCGAMWEGELSPARFLRGA